MLRIDDTIFSLDILGKKFCCDLPSCMGNCCRYGDSGAPLAPDEAAILDEIWEDVRPYLRSEGIAAIEETGTSVTDFENDRVTPLINGQECAYTIYNNGILLCGIEKAWSDGRINFRKPLSCHLFPIRIKDYSDFRAVNYQEISLCAPARKKGESEGLYVYQFLKEPLIRAVGREMYNELCVAARELSKATRKKNRL